MKIKITFSFTSSEAVNLVFYERRSEVKSHLKVIFFGGWGGGWREGGLCGIQEEKGVVICPWNCLIAFIWTEIYYFTVGFGTQLVEVETWFFTPVHFPLLHFNCFMPEIIKSSTTWKVTSIYLRTIPFKLTNVESYHQFLFSFDQSWALKIEKIPCFFCHIHGSHVATVTIFGSWIQNVRPNMAFFVSRHFTIVTFPEYAKQAPITVPSGAACLVPPPILQNVIASKSKRRRIETTSKSKAHNHGVVLIFSKQQALIKTGKTSFTCFFKFSKQGNQSSFPWQEVLRISLWYGFV